MVREGVSRSEKYSAALTLTLPTLLACGRAHAYAVRLAAGCSDLLTVRSSTGLCLVRLLQCWCRFAGSGVCVSYRAFPVQHFG